MLAGNESVVLPEPMSAPCGTKKLTLNPLERQLLIRLEPRPESCS